MGNLGLQLVTSEHHHLELEACIYTSKKPALVVYIKAKLGSTCNQWRIGNPDMKGKAQRYVQEHQWASLLGEHTTGFNHFGGDKLMHP
jgi:hypothetical protein